MGANSSIKNGASPSAGVAAAVAAKPMADPAAVYNGLGLAVYDSFVLGLNTRYAWRCPIPRIVALYNKHVTSNHLDIGVGTGYYVDHCKFPSSNIRLGLMDLSPHSLDRAARRLSRFKPETYLADILNPLVVKGPFDSVGMNWLIHCLPGTIGSKQTAFTNVRSVLKPGGVLFGATVLQGGIEHNWLAKKMLASLNEKGIFSNAQDDVEGLRRVLADSFSESSVEIVGGTGIFWARR